MGRGPFVQTVTVRKKINYEYFQHGNTRIAEIGRRISWIDTHAVKKQQQTDKIRLVTYNIYAHL